MYLSLEEDNVAYFDVDDTLIFAEDDISSLTREDLLEMATISMPNGFDTKVRVHSKQVERLKMHKKWGNGVIVWSKSGYRWAEAVVRALNLEEYVDVVLSKPTYYYDDKKCEQFMGEHRYIKE